MAVPVVVETNNRGLEAIDRKLWKQEIVRTNAAELNAARLALRYLEKYEASLHLAPLFCIVLRESGRISSATTSTVSLQTNEQLKM